MLRHLRTRRIVAAALWVVACIHGTAPAQVAVGTPSPPPPALPATTQIKKTVVFLEADCLHDFGPDIAQLTPEALARMSPQQATAMRQQLAGLIARLQRLRQSMAKLTPEEVVMLRPGALSALELPRIGGLVAKMASLDNGDIESLTPQEVATLPADSHMGTGFIVAVPDERLPAPAKAEGQLTGFGYLVTNRHVAQPGIEDGMPCRVLNYSVMLNRKGDSPSSAPRAESIPLGRGVNWHFSIDDSVDLAVTTFLPPPQVYDFVRIPVSLFATQEMAEKKLVVEGDPVLFSGLFIQSFREAHSLEPIVRSGTLAMVPNGPMETTLHKPGKVYLAEAHAFSGNSGSPVFIDTSKFANVIGAPSYSLLGVISGEVLETSDLTLRVTTTYTANVGANSDVSIVVPACEIKNILDSPPLRAERDAFIAQLAHAK
ncbi:MAG TPA: hypothetical protein VN911_04065 [Candidatus Acidoferrum sp.]|nr:hypothetical protein [Candidatus Acidoferrum sp.]